MGIVTYSQIMVVDTQASLTGLTGSTGQFAYCADTQSVLIYDGTNWQPSARVQVKKTSNAVNAKNTGSTLLYTLEPSTLNFYPVMVIPRSSGVGISGVITGPTMSIGSNSTSYNNIATSSTLGSLLSGLVGGNSQPSNTTYAPALAGGAQIFANVTLGAVATNYTVLYDIIGFYDN